MAVSMGSWGRRVVSAAIVMCSVGVAGCSASTDDATSGCTEVSVAADARVVTYLDLDEARRSGLLTAEWDVGRLSDDSEESLDRVGRMADFFDQAGTPPPILERVMGRIETAPYGLSDARCVLAATGPGLMAESIVLTEGGTAVSTDEVDVTSTAGTAVAVPSGDAVDTVPLADGPSWIASVVETFVAERVVSGSAMSNEIDGGMSAAVGVGGNPVDGTVVVVWVRPDLDSAALEHLARSAVEDAPADWRDPATPVEIEVEGEVVVITTTSPDPAAVTASVFRSLHPVVSAGLGLEE